MSISTLTIRLFVTVIALGAAACDATTGPSDLDRSRVLAVRLSPPHLAPEEIAPIDVLVGHDDGTVDIEMPTSVRVNVAEASAQTDSMVIRSGDGWAIACPPEQALEELRVQLALAPDDPIAVPLSVDVEVDGAALTATKMVFLGSAGDNPALAGIDVDGAEVDEDGVVQLAAGQEVTIGALGAGGEDELSYAWFTSAGSIDLYLSEVATFTASDTATTGQLALVVRDPRGGVAWSWYVVAVD